jgi:L-lactate dehydrogenase complex protein LldF
VYRRSGGHSYHTAVSGPIGSILTPNLDMRKHADLPFASTLCGSCTNVCPVKIDIHDQLWKWRQVLAEEGHVSASKRLSMKVAAFVLSRPGLYRLAGKMGRTVLKTVPWLAENRWNPWSKARSLPTPPAESFRDWYLRNRKS